MPKVKKEKDFGFTPEEHIGKIVEITTAKLKNYKKYYNCDAVCIYQNNQFRIENNKNVFSIEFDKEKRPSYVFNAFVKHYGINTEFLKPKRIKEGVGRPKGDNKEFSIRCKPNNIGKVRQYIKENDL